LTSQLHLDADWTSWLHSEADLTSEPHHGADWIASHFVHFRTHRNLRPVSGVVHGYHDAVNGNAVVCD
jgi:hypothetical protein